MQMPLPTMMHDLVYDDVHPPLYQILMLAWVQLLGSSNELALRLPSVLFGVLCIPVVYALAQKLLNNRIASVAAAWWISLNTFGVYYSQEARSYSLLFLLSGCAALAYLHMRAQERPAGRDIVLYVGSAVLLSYTHVFGMLFVGYLGLTDCVQMVRKRLGWAVFLKSQLWVVGLVGLWMPWMWIQVTRVQKGFWIPKPDFLFWFDYLTRYSGPHGAAVGVGSGVWVGVYGLRKRKNKSELTQILWVVGWVIFVLGVPFVMSRVGQPILHDKSATGVLMAMGVLFGWGVLEIFKLWGERRAFIIKIALILMGLGSVGSVVGNIYVVQNREGWLEMTTAVEERVRRGMWWCCIILITIIFIVIVTI